MHPSMVRHLQKLSPSLASPRTCAKGSSVSPARTECLPYMKALLHQDRLYSTRSTSWSVSVSWLSVRWLLLTCSEHELILHNVALAFSQAGWVLGVLLLIAFSALTNYTAKVLARVLADDPSLMTYADIGAKAFGQTARNFINVLFCLEISALWYVSIVSRFARHLILW